MDSTRQRDDEPATLPLVHQVPADAERDGLIASVSALLRSLPGPLSIAIDGPGNHVRLSLGEVRVSSALSAGLGAADPEALPDPPLKEIESNILEALGGQTWTARLIAERAGYKLNSYFRGVLAGLVKRGHLAWAQQKGYCRPLNGSQP